MDKPLWGLKVQAPFGARVLSFVCYAPNDGFGPQSGLVQRVVLYAAAWGSENRPTGLRSGGRRLAVRTAMEHPIGALPRTPFCLFEAFPLKGKQEIGGTGYCVIYDTDSQSRNVLASPLGEEGHKVAKGCTRVRMIMILDMDVTAERRHYNTHRPAGDTTTLGPKDRQT